MHISSSLNTYIYIYVFIHGYMRKWNRFSKKLINKHLYELKHIRNKQKNEKRSIKNTTTRHRVLTVICYKTNLRQMAFHIWVIYGKAKTPKKKFKPNTVQNSSFSNWRVYIIFLRFDICFVLIRNLFWHANIHTTNIT